MKTLVKLAIIVSFVSTLVSCGGMMPPKQRMEIIRRQMAMEGNGGFMERRSPQPPSRTMTSSTSSSSTNRGEKVLKDERGWPYVIGTDGKRHPPSRGGQSQSGSRPQQQMSSSRQSSSSSQQVVTINGRPYVIVNGQAIPIASNSSNSSNRSYGSGSSYSTSEKRAYQTYVFKPVDGTKLHW